MIDLVRLLERAAALRADVDLAKVLRKLSGEAGKDDAAADDAYHDVRYAIEGLKHRLLRQGRIGLVKKKSVIRPEDEEAIIARRVRIKSYELGIGRKRCKRYEAEERALLDFPLDERNRQVIWTKSNLRPAEARAVAIIGGAQRNARKNPIERNAITLADAYIADWAPRPKRPGRPVGRRKIVLDGEKFEHKTQLSVSEVIQVVLPIVDQLAGPAYSSSPRSTMIKTVSAAVKSSGLACTLELAASLVRKLQTGSGAIER